MDLILVLKALGDDTRIRILNLLKDGELCVCEIESILHINQSNASRHLTKLTTAGIVNKSKKAQYVYYSINENMLKTHSFLNELINKELEKVCQCEKDTKRLIKFRENNVTCEDITCGCFHLD